MKMQENDKLISRIVYFHGETALLLESDKITMVGGQGQKRWGWRETHKGF